MPTRTGDFYLDIDALLAPLLEPEDVHLLRVDPRPEHVPVIHELASMNLDHILPLLQSITIPNGTVDPADDRGDVVWAFGLRRFDDDPRGGLLLAHQWFLHLDRFGWDGVQVSVVHQAVAAYAVALQEHRLGREVRARRWWNLAAVQTEGEPRGIGLVPYVRARKLLLVDCGS